MPVTLIVAEGSEAAMSFDAALGFRPSGRSEARASRRPLSLERN
jgi:hypothetical protein